MHDTKPGINLIHQLIFAQSAALFDHNLRLGITCSECIPQDTIAILSGSVITSEMPPDFSTVTVNCYVAKAQTNQLGFFHFSI
jgi:hypothetical protein